MIVNVVDSGQCGSPDCQDCLLNRLAEDDSVGLDEHEKCARCGTSIETLESQFDELGDRLRTDQTLLSELACLNIVERQILSRRSHSMPADHPAKIGEYIIHELLGRGGMGSVYRAIHAKLNKQVAVKLLPFDIDQHSSVRLRFEREMQAVGVLDHPNMVRALDAGKVDGISFLVMEFVDGLDLEKVFPRHTQAKIADACEIVRQAALGLQSAHDHELIHRDVKPGNMMLASDEEGVPRVKVLDLGLAIVAGRETNRLTDQGQLLGTIGFMSPEQVESSDGLDLRTDIYSLGATLYWLLVGHAPFELPEQDHPIRWLKAITESEIVPVAQHRVDIPTELNCLIDRMLSRDPGHRPATMREIASALVQFSEGHQLAKLLTDTGRSNVGHRQITTSKPKQTQVDFLRTDPFEPQPDTKYTIKDSKDDFWKRITTLGCGIALIAVSTLIWVKTDGGYITVDAPESVPVTIRIVDKGSSIGEFKVTTKKKRIWYRSGNYEIQIPKAKQDEFSVTNREFVLKRWGNEQVTIRRTESSPEGLTSIDDMNQKRIEFLKWIFERNGNVDTIQNIHLDPITGIPKKVLPIENVAVFNLQKDDVSELAAFVCQHPTCKSLYIEVVSEQSEADDSLNALSRLEQLQVLGLSGRFSDAGIIQLNSLPRLHMLDLGRSDLDKSGVTHIAQEFPQLESLSLFSRQIDADDLRPLQNMRSLNRLSLNIPNASAQTLSSLNSVTVSSLVIRGENSWSHSYASSLVKMQNLSQLEIWDAARLNDDDLLTLAKSKTLKVIRLVGHTSVTPQIEAKLQMINPKIHVELKP